ncbi:hypothetical protein SS05631_a49440 (plasmid) [Sinorhizobium sp. CCBAU 05631]|uniref:Uncharacterized protein n=1 Tax=Sinorhizobium fredii (strain USDA 257) TaxID=1185652 RepID=I3XGF1_SINF2|nr:hypothetical protein USDA257_p02420 [Sinorhizobium fredii USDA 257]ASY61327.1 hypothetical protein SS05631_a49440 [Sinorhizobium sp. CCBAU 05631]
MGLQDVSVMSKERGWLLDLDFVGRSFWTYAADVPFPPCGS